MTEYSKQAKKSQQSKGTNQKILDKANAWLTESKLTFSTETKKNYIW